MDNVKTYLGANEKFCESCGAVVNKKAVLCTSCGVRVKSAGRSRITAALFALFLGGFGAHKFYLGQKKMGILYLVFFWTFIPAIVAFVEFIMLLLMSDEQFDAKYNS